MHYNTLLPLLPKPPQIKPSNMKFTAFALLTATTFVGLAAAHPVASTSDVEPSGCKFFLCPKAVRPQLTERDNEPNGCKGFLCQRATQPKPVEKSNEPNGCKGFLCQRWAKAQCKFFLCP